MTDNAKSELDKYVVDELSLNSPIKNGHVIAFMLAQNRTSDKLKIASDVFQTKFSIHGCKNQIRIVFDKYKYLNKSNGLK